MNNRRLVQLKEIAETQTGPFGSQLHEEDYVSVGTPIVTVEHLGETGFIPKNLPFVSDEDKERLSKYTLEEGDIVFSRVGSIDRCTYVTKNEAGWLFSGRCLRVRINKNANARFVSFYFRQRYFKQMMLNISVGATMPSLNTSLMDNIPIYLPELEEQNKIASLLGSLDSKIALNNRINAELEAMAKTVYDYWFVQFDFPNAEGKPYKSSGGKMVWCEELKREVPAGWEVKRLGEYADIKRGELITAKDTEIGNVKVVAAGIDYSYTHSKSNRESNTITISGSGANAGYINFWREPIFASDCITVRANSDTETLILLQFLKVHQLHILNQAKGSAQPHVYPSDIKILNFTIPSKEVFELYGKIAIPLNKRIANNEQENQQLSSLRDWLLPMLMNGQVKVQPLAPEGEQETERLMAAEARVEYGISK